MSNTQVKQRQTDAWTAFTILSFLIAAGMMAGGIFFMEASFAAKGFYAMAAIMLVHTTVTITHSVRDQAESKRLLHQLEEAKTERLLHSIGHRDPL